MVAPNCKHAIQQLDALAHKSAFLDVPLVDTALSPEEIRPRSFRPQTHCEIRFDRRAGIALHGFAAAIRFRADFSLIS
jgi:hypothetical protein